MGLIYMRTSPSGGRYIGQTIYPEEDRWNQHCRNAYNQNLPEYHYIISKAIRKYGSNNFICDILEDNLSEDKLDEREIYWIDYYKTYASDGYHGYNMTRGGSGNRKIDTKKIVDLWYQDFLIKDIAEQLNIGTHAVSFHLKIAGITSEEIITRWRAYLGEKTKERCKAIRDTDNEKVLDLWSQGYSAKDIQKELNRSPNYITAILEELGITSELRKERGFEKFQAAANAIRKDYYQDVINLWNKGYRVKEICNELNISRSSVERNLTKGNISLEERKIRSSKSIYQYDLDGNFIQEWATASEASKTLNINLSHIGQVCKGKAKTAGGFIWKYKDLT